MNTRFLSRSARTKPALAALMCAGIVLFAGPSSAQSDADVRTQVQRLNRDVQDLQREVFRSTGGVPPSGVPAGGNLPPAIAAPLTQRVNDLEQSMQNLTGQLEEVSHRLDEVSQRLDRLQKEYDYDKANPPMAMDAGASPGAGLAPGPGVLGTIPAGSTNTNAPPRPAGAMAAGTPAPAADGNAAEFDSAMKLLTAGQNEPAKAAFKGYAASHPKDEKAPEALFWAGSISYSMQKDYNDAALSFGQILRDYPKDAHAPDAMLKLGQSLIASKEKEKKAQGCVTLAAFPKTYPKAGATLLAQAKSERSKAKCG